MNLGLLSTANINNAILEGAKGADTVDVVAVGSRDGAKAQAYASEHGLERATGATRRCSRIRVSTPSTSRSRTGCTTSGR